MDKFNIKRIEGYTIMSNHHLRDKNISHAARGLLSFMLSLPTDWDYSFSGLVAISKEGKSAIRSMINELKTAKYIEITQYRNEKGYFQYNYDVYEIPYDITFKMPNYPAPENRSSVCRTSENQPQINTNKKIDKDDKKDIGNDLKFKVLINELIDTGYIARDDEQIYLYNSLFENLINNGKSYVDLYSAIHYISSRVVARDFIDESGKQISNKFGYFMSAIDSNLKKLESLKSQVEDENFWDSFEL